MTTNPKPAPRKRDKYQKMGAQLADELHGRLMLPKKYQEWVAETITRLLRQVDRAARNDERAQIEAKLAAAELQSQGGTP